MTNFAAERPIFYEGQYLGAEDLAAIVDYLRVHNSRQNIGHHSWGIVAGLELVSQEVSDTAVEYYIQPGVAVDGYGRIIVVTSPARIDGDLFASAGSGNVNVWIRYEQSEFEAVRQGFQVCKTQDDYARMNETFAIEVGLKNSILDRQAGITVNESLITDARNTLSELGTSTDIVCDGSIPYQELPVDDDDAYWLISLGHVKWSSAANNFLPLVDPTEKEALENNSGTLTQEQVYESLMSGRAKRRLAGTISESIFASEGIIRLRERTSPADATKSNDEICNERKVQSSDLSICEGKLKARELVWLEGDTRVEGDLRLFDSRLEFRDESGSDYVDRIIAGSTVGSIEPLLMQRRDGNELGGSDLQLLLGASGSGSNRFTIGSIEFSGDDICQLTATSEHKVVVQDDGKVGIGTVNPDNTLESPYTVRALAETVEVEDGDDYSIYRLETYESESGVQQWQMDLWDKEDESRKSLNFSESGLSDSRFFLESGGQLGVGTTAPTSQLHIKSDNPDIFLDINESSGINTTDLLFGSEGSTRARVFWSKSSDKLYLNHSSTNAIVIDESKVGFGTSSPESTVHITTGSDVSGNGDSGYLILGSTSGVTLGIDNNELQVRDGNTPSTMYVQHSGGDFAVNSGNSRLVVKDSGNVGIGIDSPAEKLVLNNDSGPPRLQFRQDGSGTQSSWIGHSSTNNSNISIVGGDVGIGTTSPDCRLDVSASLNESAGSLSNHVACVQNISTGTNADVLALRVASINPAGSNNFITFFGGNSAVGRIEGNGVLGVQLVSGGADFAESLPLLENKLQLNTGDVVGVHQGKISLNTERADQVLVISESAVVVGNAALEKENEKRATVAFVGQVPVKTCGAVRSGEWLIPSGKSDGSARVFSEDRDPPELLQKVVGQAWENADKEGIHYVNCAISLLSASRAPEKGLHSRTESVSEEKYKKDIDELQAQVKLLSERLYNLEKQ